MGLVKAARVRSSGEHPAPMPVVLDLPTRLAALDSPDAAGRRRAVRDLAGESSAVPALCGRLLKEQNLSVRTALFTALIRLQSPAVVSGLLPLLRLDDANLRNEAIDALQDMPEEVGPFIEGLLGDPDSDVRILAIQLLGTLAHPHAPGWLVDVVETDGHVNVCAAAADCLAEVGGPDAIGPLRRLARRFPEEPFVAFAVDMAIRRIEGR
ncbi:HEAT repeat domain-containing protein [Rhodoplanes sp. SY1]|uniref:HEAT repeat domain-containing protein n=1 Tax=Rhodoplanes sp. SY1 TaxID=3166646 RepID=UPI0038B692D6